MNNLASFLKSIADAIRSKKGTTDLINPQDFAEEIESLSSSSTSVVKSDVNFYDYDGTLLYSYSKSDFLALQEMPELPTQSGLICQEWNYGLTDAQEYVTNYGVLDIGATYITSERTTRLYIRIVSPGRMTVPLYFMQTEDAGVSINWGDTMNSTTATGTGSINVTHTYSKVGDYVITLRVFKGRLTLGHNSSSYCIMGALDDSGLVYRSMLVKVETGPSTDIGDFACCDCPNLEYVTLSNDVTYIGSNAFDSNLRLSAVIIPSSISILYGATFRWCQSMTCVVMPRRMENIPSNLFGYCYSLESITLPENISEIKSYAFQYCTSLKSITFPPRASSVGSYAFQHCYSLESAGAKGISSIYTIGGYAFYKCYKLERIRLADGVTSVGDYAFYYCYNLESVEFPNSLTSIGSYAFVQCQSLVSLILPKRVTSIGASSFSSCFGLTSVVILGSLASIGSYAFNNTKGVVYYDFRVSESIPSLSNSNTFNGIPSDCKIVVPDALYDSWIATDIWSTYASYIVKASEFEAL